MRKKILQFEVEELNILNEHGDVDESLMPNLSDDTLQWMYQTMVLAREFDAKMLAMQRQGRIATFALLKGQEACQIGAVAALTDNDWIIPAFRETGMLVAKGVPLVKMLLYNGGDERGSTLDGGQHITPCAIPVGSQTCHAAGIALGMKMKKHDACALVFFGDGATSEGDFHESLNFAGVFQTPCIFLCQNNQFAISTRFHQQTHAETVAQKAIAYGIPGIRVDGNDVFAVYAAVKEAAERAKRGEGPTLIEAVTYRLGDHTTSDDASRYRSDEEVKEWEKKEPIRRLKTYLQAHGKWSDEDETRLHKEIEDKINTAVKEYENSPTPSVEDIFTYMYEQLTVPLKEQLAYAKEVSQ